MGQWAKYLGLTFVLYGSALFKGFEVEGLVQCYVCSWHTPTKNLTMEDKCTHYNFQEEYAYIVDCEGGCEAVSIRHSKNDGIHHFRRNCVGPKHNEGVDKCGVEESKFQYLQRCVCHSDLCNKVPQKLPSLQPLMLATLSVVVILTTKNGGIQGLR